MDLIATVDWSQFDSSAGELEIDLPSTLRGLLSAREDVRENCHALLIDWPYEPYGRLEAVPVVIECILEFFRREDPPPDAMECLKIVASLQTHSGEYISFDWVSCEPSLLLRQIYGAFCSGCDIYVQLLGHSNHELRASAAQALGLTGIREFARIVDDKLRYETNNRVIASLLDANAKLAPSVSEDIAREALDAEDAMIRVGAGFLLAKCPSTETEALGLTVLSEAALPRSFPDWHEEAAIDAHVKLQQLGQSAIAKSLEYWLQVAKNEECSNAYEYLMQIVFHRFPTAPRPDFGLTPLTHAMRSILQQVIDSDEFWRDDDSTLPERNRVFSGRYGLPSNREELTERLQRP